MTWCDPWTLPGLLAWLRQVAEQLRQGLAVVCQDSHLPEGMIDALMVRELGDLDANYVFPEPGSTPAAVIGQTFNVSRHLEALLLPRLSQDLLVISMLHLPPTDLQQWSIFLGRFQARRMAGAPGPALLILAGAKELKVLSSVAVLSWHSAIRRSDRVIWAEEHLPQSRSGLAGELAVALASILCGERLDLAAKLVQAGLDDLADPLRWLERCSEQSMLIGDTICPLALMRSGKTEPIRQRIWHAQLVALFPGLEQERVKLIEMYRSHLQVDDHLRGLGVAAVEEIELGALRYQLNNLVSRPELERIIMLARIRNALAHRSSANPSDVRRFIDDIY